MKKRFLTLIACLACAIMVLCCTLCACKPKDQGSGGGSTGSGSKDSGSTSVGSATVTLDEDTKYQTMQGFGASSAWTYQLFGVSTNTQLKDDTMKKLYGDDGLGLNTFRYNVGAGGSEVHTYGDKERGAESFFVASNFDGDYSVFADESNYDFTKDKGVRELFDKALSLGNIKEVVFFANSPHYLMTKNGKAHGANEYDENLKDECYEAFSQYMLIIVNYLYENYVCEYDKDIKILISPVNEPQWKWGGSGASQEGCHYGPEKLAAFYDVFYNQLKAFNEEHSTNFIMDIFESGNYKLSDNNANVRGYIDAFKEKEWFKDMDCISVHSYGTDRDKSPRTNFNKFVQENLGSMGVSVSEYCVMQGGVNEGIDMGIYSAQVVLRDLAMINAVSWNYWLSLSLERYNYEDGLLYWDEANTVRSTRRYYAMGQFTRYITKGSVRIKADVSDASKSTDVECVAFKRPDGAIVMVVINNSSSDTQIKVNGAYANIQEIVTTQSDNWKTSEYKYSENVTSKAKSITTYVMTK